MKQQGSLAWDSPWRGSQYLPSHISVEALKQDLQLALASLAPNSCVFGGCRTPDTNDRAEGEEREEWILQLSLGEIQEIDDAVKHFERLSLPLNRLNAQLFPLPTLGPRLRERSMLLHKDKPFFMLRGISPQWFSKRGNTIIFLGIASHVGTKRGLAKGDPTVLHHITNIEAPRNDSAGEVYRGPPNRSVAIPFHNDYGAIVSLYTLSRPATGGDFFIADIHDIAGRIGRSRPDLLEVLRKPYRMSHPGIECGYEERPLLFGTPSNGMVIQSSRARLCNSFHPRPANIGELSKLQMQALDALHTAGQEVGRRISFRSGDMIFFNNMRMMHARDAYVDGNPSENTTARYLLRLILQDERNPLWEVPPGLEATWRELYEHLEEEEVVHVHPHLISLKSTH
ncbi:Clavaminate synthase [Podospora aff. communis PSN243]|uniref:Clavaminate synthase n=1 Tax=Podospora aff. communis PSN243 TaxID=3040156 RepID=A0AAV9GMY5_9PEZI|nr:Clavaminate synthase [Podospora aff. communis PSN243]